MVYGRRQCDIDNGCGKFYKQPLNTCLYCKISSAFSDLIPFNPLDWIYDLECYPNVFTASFKHPNTGIRTNFEISERKNDLNIFMDFLFTLKENKCRMIGFNNIGYDYPLIHFIINHQHFDLSCDEIYNKSSNIIKTPWEHRFSNIIWDNDRYIIQIDLYKIHHFDNDARRTSLKMLEFNMRSNTIQELPFNPEIYLTNDQIDKLILYNDNDVDETEKFYIESIDMILFREQLTKKHNIDFLNHSDKKIGTDLFVLELEKNEPGCCYSYETGRKKPRQTIREGIALKDVILPYIKFKEPEFEKIKQWLSAQIITETKGVFNNLNCTIKGFKYVFGVGGIHGSIDSITVYSDDEYIITDWDVAGYYPEIGTVNNLYPQHLSEQFCVVNNKLKEDRKQYKKGTPLNLAIKLARNGAYGDSNNQYSPFYDSQYTMAITINGQLLLCMLAQYLIDIPGLQMIQINTDGMTVRCPRIYINDMNKICKWWEQYTCLELESNNYKRMFIRDVNNYIAEDEKGKLKRKGAYGYETPLTNPYTQERLWHKNHSALIVPKAAEAALVHGQDIKDFIINHPDIMDFMLRTKVNRSSNLVLTDVEPWGDTEFPQQRVSRYYISNTGGVLVKISPPPKGYVAGQWKRSSKLTDDFYNSVTHELSQRNHYRIPIWEMDATGVPWDNRINTKNKSKYKVRRDLIESGWFMEVCNDIKDINYDNINYEYYIEKTKKLVEPLRGNKR